MAHITRIKAAEKAESEPKPQPKPQSKPTEKKKEKKKYAKKHFIFFRYLRDSWREIRQVRWPSRKATWKLFFAIIIYVLIIGGIIMLLDIFFTWLFNTII